jgi:hypothetical protein
MMPPDIKYDISQIKINAGAFQSGAYGKIFT